MFKSDTQGSRRTFAARSLSPFYCARRSVHDRHHEGTVLRGLAAEELLVRIVVIEVSRKFSIERCPGGIEINRKADRNRRQPRPRRYHADRGVFFIPSPSQGTG